MLTTLSEIQVVRIPLDSDQLKRLAPILDASRKGNRFEGILCTLSRAYSPIAGMTVLELQILPVDKRIIAALRKIPAPDLNPKVSRADVVHPSQVAPVSNAPKG